MSANSHTVANPITLVPYIDDPLGVKNHMLHGLIATRSVSKLELNPRLALGHETNRAILAKYP
jgi:hypothetical protein